MKKNISIGLIGFLMAVTLFISPNAISANWLLISSAVAAVWGGITGTLSSQSDLQSALDAKGDVFGPASSNATEVYQYPMALYGDTTGKLLQSLADLNYYPGGKELTVGSIVVAGNAGTPYILASANLAFTVSTTEMLRLFNGAGGLVQVRNNLSNQNVAGDGNVGMFGAYNTTSDPLVLPFKYGWIGEKFMIGATTGSGATYIPNTKLDLRQYSAAASHMHFTNDTTGHGTGDGTKVGIDASGNFEIVNQESGLAINLTTTGSGIALNTTGSKPTCNSTRRKQIFITEGGSGVADTVEVCLKDAADAYAWVTK